MIPAIDPDLYENIAPYTEKENTNFSQFFPKASDGIEYTPLQNRHILPVSQSTFDEASDAQIRLIFDSPCNLHTMIEYSYAGKTYPFLLIVNPQKHLLETPSFKQPVNWSFVFASMEPLPQLLETHLKELAPISQDGLIQLGEQRTHNIKALYFLIPLKLHPQRT